MTKLAQLAGLIALVITLAILLADVGPPWFP